MDTEPASQQILSQLTAQLRRKTPRGLMGTFALPQKDACGTVSNQLPIYDSREDCGDNLRAFACHELCGRAPSPSV
jgi:hypothetical protein